MTTAAIAAGLRALAANPLRTLLATLGVIVGTAALVAVLAVGDGVEAYARDQIAATTDLPVVRVPGDSIPPPRVWADKNPEADTRLKAARAAVTEVAGHLNLPVENVLTPELLRRVAWSPPQPLHADAVADALAELGARRWQIDATAQVIASAFVEAPQALDEASNDGSSE